MEKNECRCCSIRDNGSQELEIVIKTRDKMGKEQIFLQGEVIVQNDKYVLQERFTIEVISMLYLSWCWVRVFELNIAEQNLRIKDKFSVLSVEVVQK